MRAPPTSSSGERLAYTKTKIIATVGPASDKPETLRELMQAGVDVFRLNFAHGVHAGMATVVENIRGVSASLGRPVGILADLAGPKIRLEKLPDDLVQCDAGEEFEFVRHAAGDNPRQLTCTYEPLVDELNVGDLVMLADGTVSMRVTEKFPREDRVVCVVEQAGEIRSKQGINLPGVVLSTPSLTAKDRDDLAWAVAHGIDFIGLSFVRSAQDIDGLRAAINAFAPGYEPQIVAKIEKMEAVSQLEQILEKTDAVMVARGDLGVEVDLALVPIYQKRIIKLCNQHRIPVITATQMLDSMEHNSRPTRAEAADVANAVLDGTDAVMLSGETAIGKYPITAVQTMSRIAHEAECLLPPGSQDDPFSQARTRALAVTEAVTRGAGITAQHLNADLIVVATHTGRTAMAVSKQRNRVPVLGVSNDATTARRMSLFWGVTPLVSPLVDAPPQELLRMVIEWGKEQNLLKSGSILVLVANSNWSAQGHDTLLVHVVP